MILLTSSNLLSYLPLKVSNNFRLILSYAVIASAILHLSASRCLFVNTSTLILSTIVDIKLLPSYVLGSSCGLLTLTLVNLAMSFTLIDMIFLSSL